MNQVLYKEEGVASAVGTIFAILIFVTVLGIVITTYVPATMQSYEEQYSEGILNSMVQLTSDISFLISNYKAQSILLVPFDLASNYVPLFSTPTYGSINITPPTGTNGEGTISVIYNNTNVTVGGSIQVYTNNRYFTDEEYIYEYSSLIFNQVGSGGKIGSVMESELFSINTPVESHPNITITLINLVGGPLILGSGSPVTISLETLAKNNYAFMVDGSSLIIKANSYQFLNRYFYSYLNQTANSFSLIPSFHDGELMLSFNGIGFVNLQVYTIFVSQSQF